MSTRNNQKSIDQKVTDDVEHTIAAKDNNANDDTIKIENPETALAAAQTEQEPVKANQLQPQLVASKVQDASEFGKVAVVYGGNSNERSVSLDSGAAVLLALQNQGVDATHFDPKYQEITELLAYDRVFNVLHGRGGEDGVLQGMLQWLDIPQTGSGILASALGMDKVRTKQLWQGCGLATAPFSLLTADTDWQQVVNMLGLPLIIKPVKLII